MQQFLAPPFRILALIIIITVPKRLHFYFLMKNKIVVYCWDFRIPHWKISLLFMCPYIKWLYSSIQNETNWDRLKGLTAILNCWCHIDITMSKITIIQIKWLKSSICHSFCFYKYNTNTYGWDQAPNSRHSTPSRNLKASRVLIAIYMLFSLSSWWTPQH